jgi:hypothetical protein
MQGSSIAFQTGAMGMYMGNSWDINDMKAAQEQAELGLRPASLGA